MDKKKAASIRKRASASQGTLPDKKSQKLPPSKRAKPSERPKSKPSDKKLPSGQKKPSELRKKAGEEALDRYRLLAESSRDIILFIRRSDGRVLEANRAAVETYGYTHDELLGMNIRSLRFPEEKSVLTKQMKQADKGAVRFEAQHVCKDGRVITVEVNSCGTTLKGERILLSIVRDITARRRADERLRESEALYRDLVDTSQDLIWQCDAQGRYTYLNPAWEKVFGYSISEMLGRRFSEFQSAENAERDLKEFDRLMKGHTIKGLETVHVGKDGREIHLVFNAKGVRDGQGKLAGTRGTAYDITERKKAEDVMQRSEERFRALIEHSHDAITLLAEDGTVLYDSPSIGRVLGYSPTERVGRSVFEFVHPEDRRKMADGFAGFVLQPGAVDPSEGRFLHKDGRLRRIEGVRTNLLHESTVRAVVVNYRDITERKQAEEALKISEEKYRLVVENANDAILVLQDGMVKFPNQKAMAISGYAEEEITGVPFSSFIHPEDRGMVLEMHRRRLQGEDVPLTYSFRFMNKFGKTIWVEVSGVMITWEGRPATLVFLKDITVQKQLEEQLLQSQKMEAIGTLAGGIAHNFNNLLMAILGYTSLMLMKTEASHPFYEKLKIIEKQVENGAELTRQLLGFARAGKYQLKPTDVNDLIVRTLDTFGRMKKEIAIQKKLQQGLYAIEADAGQIEQVLFNLYVNAWEAMPSGGRLYIETRNTMLDERQVRSYKTEPGPYVQITVTDTGDGMDAETQKRIFEPFFSTRGVGKGSGLGLASAYGIIRNHGGSIHVDSEKGQGTTFTVFLPASEVKPPMETRAAEGSLPAGRKTVLIVDDEREVLAAVTEILKELGYNTLTAESGMKAVELFRRHSKDIKLVILDMIMPEMNGRETLRKLMEIDRNVRVLLSSGYNIEGEATHILEMGCRGFIQKPFRIAELSRKVREVMDNGDLS